MYFSLTFTSNFLTFDSFDVKTWHLSMVVIVSLDLNNDFTFELHFWCSSIGIFRNEADKNNYRNSLFNKSNVFLNRIIRLKQVKVESLSHCPPFWSKKLWWMLKPVKLWSTTLRCQINESTRLSFSDFSPPYSHFFQYSISKFSTLLVY